MYCSNCGQQVYDDDMFCPFCGAKLKDTGDAKAPRKTDSAGKRRKKSRPVPVLITAAVLAVLAFATWKFALPEIKKVINTPEQPAAVTAEPVYVPEAAPPMTAAPSTPAPAVPVAPAVTVQPAPVPVQDKYSSGAEKPLMSDFDYYGYVQKYGIWGESEFFTDFASIMGPWKVYIVHDPYRNMNSYCEELVNIDITGSEANAEITLKWREIYFENSEIIDTSHNSDSHYYGSYSTDEGLYCTGPGNILIDRFCRYDGHEYGFGTLLSPDGVIADFFLKR